MPKQPIAPEPILTNDEIIDNLINWVALSNAITGKPQNIRRDLIPRKYASDVHRLRSTMKNWLIYTKLYTGLGKSSNFT